MGRPVPNPVMSAGPDSTPMLPQAVATAAAPAVACKVCGHNGLQSLWAQSPGQLKGLNPPESIRLT